MDKAEATGVLLALADLIEWGEHKTPMNCRYPDGKQDDVSGVTSCGQYFYYIWKPACNTIGRDGLLRGRYRVLCNSDGGQDRCPTRYRKLDEAKRACTRHLATGDWS